MGQGNETFKSFGCGETLMFPLLKESWLYDNNYKYFYATCWPQSTREGQTNRHIRHIMRIAALVTNVDKTLSVVISASDLEIHSNELHHAK